MQLSPRAATVPLGGNCSRWGGNTCRCREQLRRRRSLYRHYPTKIDLVQAVLAGFFETLVERAEAAAQAARAPGDAMIQIVKLLTDFIDEASENRAIKASVDNVGEVHVNSVIEGRGLVALQALVDAAHRDGDLLPGITANDVYLLMRSAPTAFPKAARGRWLDLLLAGIHQRPAQRRGGTAGDVTQR